MIVIFLSLFFLWKIANNYSLFQFVHIVLNYSPLIFKPKKSVKDMNRLKKGIFFYFSLILFSVILKSCCEEMNIEIIGTGDMVIQQLDNFRSDTIKSDFIITQNLEVKYSSNLNNFGVIQNSYATSCDENYINTINGETLQLFCNKVISFDGEMIPANTDFVDFDKMEVFIEGGEGGIQIIIKKEFIELEPGIYEFRVNAQTSDEINLTNSSSAYFDI